MKGDYKSTLVITYYSNLFIKQLPLNPVGDAPVDEKPARKRSEKNIIKTSG